MNFLVQRLDAKGVASREQESFHWFRTREEVWAFELGLLSNPIGELVVYDTYEFTEEGFYIGRITNTGESVEFQMESDR